MYLSKNSLRPASQDSDGISRENNEDTQDDPSNHSNNHVLERKRIIELLFFNVSVDQQYLKHLNELRNMEETRGEEDVIGFC